MNTLKQIALLIAGAQGLLLSFALFLSGWRKRKPAVYLAPVLVVLSLELLNALAMSLQYHNSTGAFPFWIFGSYLLLPPALWLFMQSSFNPKFKPLKSQLLWFIPAFTEIITEFSAFYLQKFSGLKLAFLKWDVWFYLTEILPIAATIAVLVISSVKLKKQANLANHRKQQGFSFAFTALTLLWATDSVLHVDIFNITEILLCCLLFTLGYIVYFQPLFFEAPPVNKSQIMAGQFSAYNDKQSMAKLKQLFEEQQIYLRPRLTVEDIGNRLDLPHRYVSYLINHVCGSNFSNFVNTYRVNEVLRRMKDPRESHKNLLGIALDSGFSSKSSFNQIFKAITGETPSAYLARQRETVPEA